jgi:hypothetical protein
MYLHNSTSEKQRTYLLRFFASVGSMYILVLKFADGRTRTDILRIRKESFVDRCRVLDWYSKVRRQIASCIQTEEHKTETIRELDYLFKLVTSHANRKR